MGEHEGWSRPSGLLPNGLLPDVGSSIRALDSERWFKAEERTAELIACIQPNQPSEERRNAVAHYVQRLVMKCFPCQVFTFGSVPLKTYLPDGDIDLTAFSNNQGLKETWANQVRDMLESEEKNANAEFHVKEVQYIQAEVKIIKCLVENIVVDISFNQLGGLCTLCFLEEVDHLINHNHLFKRSIILIKAWCYYESRILGAHHGLISTYALETLVLYIFHVFNNSFTGPLEVLYRFLEFFSNFDWDNFCVSLWGPVSISSLPDMTAEPPRRDSGELLLSKVFLEACSSVYAVFPGGQENQGQPFVSKHFNVIDPLRINNNLGRSVSKGNFFRIRSAFAFGAKKLEKLLSCHKENLVYEVNQFFMNTWERHGSGNRPDAPVCDLWNLRLPTSNHHPTSENLKNNLFGKKISEKLPAHETEGEGISLHDISSHHGNYPLESMSWTSNAPVTSTLNQKNQGSSNSARASKSNQTVGEDNSYQVAPNKNQRNMKPDNLTNEIQSRSLFARTRSSPELTDAYNDVSSQGRRNRAVETGKNQTPSRVESNFRKPLQFEISAVQSGQHLADDMSSVRHITSQQSFDACAESNIGSNSYNHDSGSCATSNDQSSAIGTHGMLQEEQDLANLMASSMVQGFNGQVHLQPMNLSSNHFPLPISPSMLASMGYNHRNVAGMVPANIPLIDPSFAHMQFSHGLVTPSLAQYFPGIGLASNVEDSVEQVNENFGSMEINPGEVDHDTWLEQDVSTRVFEPEKRNFEVIQSDDKRQPTSNSINYASSLQESSSPSSTRVQKFGKEQRGLMQGDRFENLEYQDNRGNEVSSDERMVSSRFSSASHSSSLRSKTSSESSWDGSSAKGSKAVREKRGKKTVALESSSGYGKGKSLSEKTSSTLADEEEPEWKLPSNVGVEMAERSSLSQSISSVHAPRHHLTSHEQAQPSGSDSMVPIAPVIIGPNSRQRMTDNAGVFAFYPTGPPVPFLTMLPLYNIPHDIGTTNASTAQLSEDGLDNSDSGQNFESTDGLDQSEELGTSNSFRGATLVESSDEPKSDILNSDFASHWQNLQFGRFCQNPRYNGPPGYPSPVMVPPVYLQGRVPWDGPGRPSGNLNLFTQLMSYSPRLVPVAPLQSVSSRPPSGFQRFPDDIPRYRSGTGTYLPNPKISARERHSLGTRKGSYNYDRGDSHGDRENNWNVTSRSRASGRSHNRSQIDKSSSRPDRLSENRTDRSWSSYRQESFPSYHSQNGPLCSSSSQGNPSNVAYGMYPMPNMVSGEASSNGPGLPSVVMLYPLEHSHNYVSHGEQQIEFGSLGPVGFSGGSEFVQLSDGNQSRGAYEEQRFFGGSMRRSSPDQPSSPHHQRRI